MKTQQEIKSEFKRSILVLFLCLLTSIVVYWPVLGSGIASDDYEVLLRVSNGEILNFNSFFRPVSDISIYFCYLAGGLNEQVYVLYNITIHALCGLIFYKICRTLFEELDKCEQISIIGTFFFILFPFHHESIVWVVGRGSSMSAFLACWALYLSIKRNPNFSAMLCASVLFFLALCTYENTIVLPVIAALFVWRKNPDADYWWKWFLLFLGTAILNLLVRYFIIHLIVGDYGARIFEFSTLLIAVKLFKASGRLLLPPIESGLLMIILSSCIGFFLLIISWQFYKKKPAFRSYFLITLFAFGTSFILTVLFGVSTRTLEGDRLFYFPSFFLCIWLPFVFVYVFNKKQLRWVVGLIGVYFIFSISFGNGKWERADLIEKKILNDINSIKMKSNGMVLLNLPEEYAGAHIFRNGFLEALALHGIDTVGIIIGSFSSNSGQIQKDSISVPKIDENGFLKVQNGDTVHINDKDIPVYYWNNKQIVPLF